jgi:vancomycin resistance protein YoaR
MPQRNFPEYGPIQRRRGSTPTRPMATPMRDDGYTGATLPMRTVVRRQAPPPPNGYGRRGGSGWWWKVPLLLSVLLVGAGFAGLAWLDRQYSGRIYPNVTLQGVDLSQKTIAEAQQLAEAKFGDFLRQPITIAYQGQTWQPTAQELGMSVNLQRAVTDAYNAGRGNGFVQNVSDVGAIYQQGKDLPLKISIDGTVLSAYLAKIARDVEQVPQEATLNIVDAQVQTSSSVEGRMVLIDETMAEVEQALRTLQPQTIALRTATFPPQLTTDGIAEAQRTTEAMLSSPLELVFGENVYTLEQAELADMITLQRLAADGRTILNAQLDQAKLKKWATKLADRIGRSSVEPRVAWNGGNLLITREGRIGYRLDVDRTVEMINGAVTTVTRRLDLPVDEVQPQVTPETLGSLGITELVSVGRSDFTGSAPYRVTNIKVGLEKLNGILIAPDAEFSFNENVGAISEENGFVEGYAIVGNRTQLEPGGGICQDSTTLFRAAFYAGLPFTDWTPHRFRISWYEKYDTIGMDSTIYQGGGPDLRFVNDTGNWLLIQSYANEADGSVTVALYGTKVPGREVERTSPKIANETPAPTKPVYIDDPEQPLGAFKQTDTARGGMDIEIVRYVKQDGQVVRTDTFRTSFQAWPNIYLKNPATPTPAGGN